MLSILCSTLWGHVGRFNVGVFIGGLMMQTKHGYKREDVKKDKLEKWYLNYLKNTKYPLIEEENNRVQKLLSDTFTDLKNADTLDQLVIQANLLKANLASQLISPDALQYFKDTKFKSPSIAIPPSADLAATRRAYNNIYAPAIGDLGVQTPNTLEYPDATGVFKKADTNPVLIDTRRDSLNQINDIGRLGGANFLQTVKIDGTLKSAADQAKITALQLATTAYIGNGTAEAPQAPGYTKDALQRAGKALVQAWVNEKMRIYFSTTINNEISQLSERLDDPLERALKAYQADQAKAPSADEYNPEGTRTPPLTSPEVCDKPGEQDNWETLKGEENSKRIGLTYGFSVGYEKEMNNNHAFVGGNAFAKKDSMTIKYDLQVEKGSRANFGELETKPGYTFGLTVIAGKHLNPVFSVFGRGTFEFTKYDFTYNLANESPKIAKESMRTQTLGNWVKQAAVGVGARYNFAPLWSAEACYDFVPTTKTDVRDFNKLGEDDRRRGYIYTTSQHRVFLKVVRFFNM